MREGAGNALKTEIAFFKITFPDQLRYRERVQYRSTNTSRWGSLVATLAAVYPSAGLGRGSGSCKFVTTS